MSRKKFSEIIYKKMSLDFEQLKKDISKLSIQIGYLNYHYKNEESLTRFLSTESKIMDELRLKLFTCTKIIHKLNNKKRKLEFEEKVSSECLLKKKKLNEKHQVVEQLNGKAAITEQISAISNETISDSLSIPQGIHRCCYVCKKYYTTVHFFYDRLCPSCGELNYKKRTQKCDLTSKIAVVTGCRIKIGYELCLYLLRNNCFVIGTTRFSKDAFLRYSKEPDFNSFKHLLKLYPLDLRDLGAVNKFITYLYSNFETLDIIINNAAQTLRRNVQFYKHLLNIETKPLESFQDEIIYEILPCEKNELWSTCTNIPMLNFNDETKKEIATMNGEVSLTVIQAQIPVLSDDLKPDMTKFPINVLDKDQQQVDLSEKNSWKLEIDEINMFEFAETQLINAWTPFFLCSKLKKLMSKGDYESRFIVNVSSMEGKYNRRYKSSQHSHTNMSKASLNMLTRTCGSDFSKSNIYMTSVDTGWVSEMNPFHLYRSDRTVPLDEIDGAMRVLDPIIQGLIKKIYLHSVFLKDYKETSW
jgi:NAD(P)-dependent dehydrogenase (short-subunit alcohol dehydrogenase family)